MTCPSPEEVGLPEKFERWREGQWQCIEDGVTCEERADAHCVPTGGGKSPSLISQVLLSIRPGQRVAILTATLGLQKQYMDDFGEHLPIANIMGKSNYKCSARPGWTCEDGHAGRCPNAGTVKCEYSNRYFKALASPIVLTNYSFWMAVHKYGHGLGDINHLYMDEAHCAFKEVSNAVQVQISSNEIEEILGCKFPRQKDSMDMWKVWASPMRIRAQEAAKEMLRQIVGAYDVKQTWVREYRHLRNLTRKLGTLGAAKSKDWIVDDWEHGFQFDTIRPSAYAEGYLYRHIPRLTFYSATMTTKTLQMIGMRNDYKFWEYPSVFSVEGNLIMHVPTCRNNRNMTAEDTANWLQTIDAILGPRNDRRGLVQTVSYDRRDQIFRSSAYARWMHTNNKGDVTAEVVERYRRAKPPAALISPSVMTGWDFMYDDARYNILCKVPWPAINTKLFMAREAFDPMYGAHLTAESMVQAVGRTRRAEDDWSETFIPDDGVAGFRRRYYNMMPVWFHKAYRDVSEIPPPPPMRRELWIPSNQH